MFETLVTGVLTNVLGSYIDPKCFSSDKINVQVWSGYVVLRDLEMKPEAVAHPAVQFVRGVIGSVELKIPWNRLQSESVVLTIDDVYLLVRTEEDIEAVLMEMDEFTIKKRLLEQLYQEAKEKQDAEHAKDNAQKTGEDGFASRLVNRIIDNIELHIRRVHLRLEDRTSGDHPFSGGVTVESVHAQSTNSSWQPSFVDNAKNLEPRIYKMIELNHLSVYLDPHCDILVNQALDLEKCLLEEFCHAFNHSIPKRFDDRRYQLYPSHQRHHFMLKPVDASARLIVNRDPFDTSIPKFEVDVSITEIAFRFEDSQYCDLLYLAAAFQIPEHHKKYQQHRRFRPRKSILESSAKEWWIYAIKATRENIRGKKMQWSWRYLKERRDDRKKYVQLWQKQMLQIELGPNRSYDLSDSDGEGELEDNVDQSTYDTMNEESEKQSVISSLPKGRLRRRYSAGKELTTAEELEIIERKRSIEDICFFRYLADKELREQGKAMIAKAEEDKPHLPMPAFSDSDSVDTETTESSVPIEMRYRSWGKWMFGWTSQVGAAPSLADANSSPKRGFPEVELRELFKIVEYEPAKRAKKRSHGHRGVDIEAQNRLTDLDDESGGLDADLVSRITISLAKGSITLSSDRETNKKLMRDDASYGERYNPTDFLLGTFSHLQVAAITRGDSTKVDVSLQSIEAFDESADSMAFSRLLTRKHRAMAGHDDEGGIIGPNRMAGPIFLMSYETNPIDGAADAVLYVHMEPLEIVFSPTARCWGRLASYLNTPQVLGLWAELEVASFNDIMNLKARTEAKLKYVMANRVALSVDLRIQAPVIIIPESDTDYDCARMVVDLGHINIRTDRLSKLDDDSAVLSASSTSFSGRGSSSSIGFVNPLSSPNLGSSMGFVKQLYDEAEKGEGAIRWKEEFYDKFTISVTNVHVLLVPYGTIKPSSSVTQNGIPSTSAHFTLSAQEQEWELIEHFNINVTVRTSVLPLDATLTRFYVHADLPALTFNVSLDKYFQLMNLVARFNGDATAETRTNIESSEDGGRLGAEFLDNDGLFLPERRRSFLSTSALQKLIEEDIGTPQNDSRDVLTKDDLDDMSDAESDDTWFSITSGSMEQTLSDSIENVDTAEDSFPSVPQYMGKHAIPHADISAISGTRSRPRKGPARPTSVLVDRRIFVCTFTIPTIAIQLKKPQSSSVTQSASFQYTPSIFEDDTPDNGTLLIKLEGFRVRVAKKTLSTQLDLCVRSLEVEDYTETGGRTSEYLLFSCPSIEPPYDILSPPRQFQYGGAVGARRRVGRQRERVISIQPSGNRQQRNLLEFVYASSNDRRTGEETSRDLDVRCGAVHVVFDQSYICSMLELLEETASKMNTSAANQKLDEFDDEFSDALPPPLELNPSIAQEYSLPVLLTDSVMADLEQARKEYLDQNISAAPSGLKGHQDSTTISMSIGVSVHSLSICFCDRGETVASLAVVEGRVQVSSVDDVNITVCGSIRDLRLFDLGSKHDAISQHQQTDSRSRFVSIFGLQHSFTSTGKENLNLISFDSTIKKCDLRNNSDQSGDQSGDTSSSDRSTVLIRAQPAQLFIQTTFIESVVNYIIHGALLGHLAAPMKERVDPVQPRRKRSESFSLDDSSVSVPPSGGFLSPSVPLKSNQEPGIYSPFFDAVDNATGDESSARSNTTPMQLDQCDEHRTPECLPANQLESLDSVVSLMPWLDATLELVHPTVIVPCGSGDSTSEDGLLIDLGLISVQRNAIDSRANDNKHNQIKLSIADAQLCTLRDRATILEKTTLTLVFDMETRTVDNEIDLDDQSLQLSSSQTKTSDVSISVIVSPVEINIGEQHLCLGVDLWNDVIQPILQISAGATRSLRANSESAQSRVVGGYSARANSGVSDDECIFPQGIDVNGELRISVECVRFNLISESTADFEVWLRNSTDYSETTQDRDSNMPANTPVSPRRRRIPHSFSSKSEYFVPSSAVPSTASVVVAEASIKGIMLEVTAKPGTISHQNGKHDFSGALTMDKIEIRDRIADSSEHFDELLTRDDGVYNRNTNDINSVQSNETILPPQVKLTASLSRVPSPVDVPSTICELQLTCSVAISSARFCVVPRSLLRIEHYAVGAAVGFAKKISQQDPRITTRDHPSTVGSENGMGGTRELLQTYASTSRTRKNSVTESVHDGSFAVDTAQDKRIAMTADTTQIRASSSSENLKTETSSSVRIYWVIHAELSRFELWMLSSDRRKDAMGLCFSNAVSATFHRSPIADACDNPAFQTVMAAATVGNIQVRVDTPFDSNSHVRDPNYGHSPSWSIVDPFNVGLELSVDVCSRLDDAQGESKLDDMHVQTSSDLPMDSVWGTDRDYTKSVPSSWMKWSYVKPCVKVDPVCLHLSYREIPVLSKITMAISTFVGLENVVRAPLSFVTAHEDPYLELMALGSEVDHELQDTMPNEDEQLVLLQAKLILDEVQFRLINNLVGEDSPVIGFHVGQTILEASVTTGVKTEVSCSCSVEAWYHNLRLVSSEPLVEPWSFKVQCSHDHVQVSSSGSMSDFYDIPPWKLIISSQENLQWNITDALVVNAMAAMRAWEWVTRDSGDSPERAEYSTYWIRNHTGLKLRYWGTSCQMSELVPGKEEPLAFVDNATDKWDEADGLATGNRRRQPLERKLFIAVDEPDSFQGDDQAPSRSWESEFAIPVDQPDSRMYALLDPDADVIAGDRVRKCECVIDVLVERGCKVFVVRSTLMLENKTASDLEIEFVPPLRRTASSPSTTTNISRGYLVPSWKTIVKTASAVPVPVNIVSSTDGYLMVRPPEMKSADALTAVLPKAYAKKRVHVPLFDRTGAVLTNRLQSDDSAEPGSTECILKFHRLYGDRPVRPFMMSASLTSVKGVLYHRKLSFYAPLVVHNLTAGPLEFSLATPSGWNPAIAGIESSSSSVNLGWEDCQQRLRERGTIEIADSLVWHLCDWDTPLELRVRMKGFEWSEPLRVVEEMEERSRVRMADLSSNANLYITAETKVIEGRCREVFLFVPYWIVNLTGMKLEYEYDDERASYDYPTMLLAGQKHLDRDELLVKEEQTRSRRNGVHSHIIHHLASTEHSPSKDESHGSTRDVSSRKNDDRTRRHPGIIPSAPPIKGLLDLIPKPLDDAHTIGQLEVLQASHSSPRNERGSIRLRVNDAERQRNATADKGHTKWSESIILDQAGTSGELEAVDFSVDRVYSVGFSISTGKGRYSRTKVIMLAPRFMIVNTLDLAVEVCHSSARGSPNVDDQSGGVVSALNPAVRIGSGGYVDFHWSLQLSRSKTIRCRVAEYGWSWSGAVPLHESGEFVIRMRNESTRATKLVRVVLTLDTPCVCVYLREENSSAPPYRIENYSLETFRVHQNRVQRSEILLPHHSSDYAWDEPTQERIIVVDMLPSAAGDNSRPLRIGAFALDKIRHFPDALGGTLGIELIADGPTRVLRFTDTRLRGAGGIDANGNANSGDLKGVSDSDESFPGRFLSMPSLEFALNIQGIGISVVDSTPKELVYLSFADLSLEAYISKERDPSNAAAGIGGMHRLARDKQPKIVAMRFRLRDFQIDNQLQLTPYPVLLRFSNSTTRSRIVDGKSVSIPVIDVCLVKHDGYKGINFIRHFSVKVLPLHIRVDGSLLYQLLPVFSQGKGTGRDLSTGLSRSWYTSEVDSNTQLLDDYNSSLKVGVEILEAVRGDGTASVAASSETEKSSSYGRSDRGGTLRSSFAVSNVVHGKTMTKTEDTKLYFEEFLIDPIRATVSFSFGASAGAMVDGLHMLADESVKNSAATVGPLRLIINAIGTSLTKIANAPFHLHAIHISHSFIQPDVLAVRVASHYQSEALRQAYVILGSVDVLGNPMIAWRNMKGGFQDFINEPVHGMSKSPTEFALGIGRGTYSLMRASVYTFLDFNSRIVTATSLGLSEACLKLDEYTGYPATRNIYQGVAQGISGLVVSPIRAVEIDGVRGVVPGLFAGVFGLVLKPLLGFSLATATTVTTLRDAIDPNTKALLIRSRPPRFIDMRTRKLKVYSYVESLGEELVGKIRGGRYRSDGYVGHLDLKQKCLIITRKRILYVDVKGSQKYEVEWDLPADELVMVDWRTEGEDTALLLYYIAEDFSPRRRAALYEKGMTFSKLAVTLPENRVLFVRAMLQQQERSRYASSVPAGSAVSITTGMPSPIAQQRSMSTDALPMWQQRFPSEYPIFKNPPLVATRSVGNLHQSLSGTALTNQQHVRPGQHLPSINETNSRTTTL